LSLLLLAAVLLLSAALLCSGHPPGCPVPLPTQTADNNPRLQRAFVALQALKKAIIDDPNLTEGWCDPDVCAYFGVFCALSLDDPCARTVAGVDLNHGDLAGTLRSSSASSLTSPSSTSTPTASRVACPTPSPS
jgi:hypothetical protein